MESYLLVMYVTQEQEEAIKMMFQYRNWIFRKKDLQYMATVMREIHDTDTARSEAYLHQVPEVNIEPKFQTKTDHDLRNLTHENHLATNNVELTLTEKNNGGSGAETTCSITNLGLSSNIHDDIGEDKDETVSQKEHEEEAFLSNVDLISTAGFELEVEAESEMSSNPGLNKKNITEQNDSTPGTNYSANDGPEKSRSPTPTEDFAEKTTNENDHAAAELPETTSAVNNDQMAYPQKKNVRVKTCDICGEMFAGKYSLSRHKDQCHPSSAAEKITEEFPCNLCEKSFRNVAWLSRHQKSDHGISVSAMLVLKKYEANNACESSEEVTKKQKKLDESLNTEAAQPDDPTGEAKPFACQICSKNLKSIECLKQHLKTHLPDDKKPFHCQTCGKAYVRKQDFENHLRDHTGERPFECDLCDKKYGSDYQLKKHIKKHAPDHLKQYQCKECKKGFLNRIPYLNHLRSHTNDFPHKCDICPKAYRIQKSLDNHLLWHKGIEKPKTFLCDVCGNAFAQKAQRDAHKMIHTGEKNYICDICGHACRRPQNLVVHRRKHTGEKPYKCEYCDRRCTTKTMLDSHRHRIHPETRMTKKFACDSCPKTFFTRRELKVHVRKHSGDKPFPCLICPKRFHTKSTLKVHERVHSAEKPYVCEICGKAFLQPGGLLHHRKIHLGIKDHICRFCSMGFVSQGQLIVHERTHTGEKPYKCSVCGKAFATSHNRYGHERIHSKDKPFSCHICGKSFRENRALNKHYAVHDQDAVDSGKSFMQSAVVNEDLLSQVNFTMGTGNYSLTPM